MIAIEIFPRITRRMSYENELYNIIIYVRMLYGHNIINFYGFNL